ncbi:GNAT family N-acetyltransferase [Pseudomonas abieticivorans]|uniref:GNAT family N-acetyltransferase n=1 Tax=Pseudomonas abieticivorans TaxID=2931382 RepID=UPI0020C15C8D|nr:GNAT family N-acetyltransferase [Pseudomonas sp. PIA16]
MATCHLLRKDLTQGLAPVALPTGVHPVAFEHGLLEPIHGLLELGYQQGGGEVPALQDWLTLTTRDAEFDPALCLLLADEHGLVAVAQGWRSAFIKDLVVHPRARNRGIGLALLQHCFEVYRQRGEPSVDLKVLDSNLNARRLYERAGMLWIARYTL